MKKSSVSLLICLFLIVLAFTGCQEQSKKTAPPLGEAAEKALADRQSLVAYTADDLADLTGILPEDYTEALFLVGSDSLSGREVIAVRAKDAGCLNKVTEALQNYLSQRMEETRNYLPDAYQLQSQAKVESKHLTAVLIVGAQSAEETKAFLAGE
ncbi:MAG: DUF4358 domain-containing protein [Clostridia bacterium]|nr:DUF4358 domain-containing protein [Clostridia bacterium]